jgi:tetratricopeptide (TPR) repeat protein
MICAKCGVPNPAGSIYCGGCGLSLEQASTVLDASTLATLPDDDEATVRMPPSGRSGILPVVKGESAPASPIQPVSGPSQPIRVTSTDSPPSTSPNEVYPKAPSAQPIPGFTNEQQPSLSPADSHLTLDEYPPSSTSTLDFTSERYAPPASPSGPGFNVDARPAPSTPTPGFPSGAYPPPASNPGFTIPAQPASTPSFPSGAYPPPASNPGFTIPAQPASTPGFPSGAYPPPASNPGFTIPAQPASTPGFPSGAYPPPATPSGSGFTVDARPAQPVSMPGFPSGAYPPPATPSGSGFTVDARPAQPAPAPGFISGVYPPPATPSGSGFTVDARPAQPTPGFAQASGALPAQPSQPGWPGYTGQLPQPGWPGYQGQGAVPPPAQQASPLIKPLPLWAFILSIVAGAVVLALLVFLIPPDWATGAQDAGWIAFGIGGAILIAFIVRTGLGMLAPTNPRRRSQVISAIALALLLFAVGTFGLTQQASVHAAQARFSEGQKQWQNAIDEYTAAGEGPPSSTNIARIYNEWGEELVSQQKYSDALDKFDMVIIHYSQATDQVSQAVKDEISAANKEGYAIAIMHYDNLLSQASCQQDSNCKTMIADVDATAYYNLAEQQLSAQQYSDAANTFKQLTTNTNFQGAPEVQKAHPDYAKALWGKAQQELHTTCSDALSIYQQLISSFSDTPEGQQAANGLKAPVQVTGRFTSTVPPASTTPFVMLATTPVPTGQVTFDQFNAVYSNSPHTSINSDGTFSFASITPGAYYFAWGTLTDSDGGGRYYALTNSTTIGQLCTYDFGNISATIPSA